MADRVAKTEPGIGHSASSACRRLKLSSQYNVNAKYLVEVFKYTRTGNHIPTDAADGYGSTPMIGLYSLVEPYSIARITTTQSGVVGKDGKKKSTSKCYCSLCDYVVQNHPSINNHVCMHLCLSLLSTINGCFHIEHGCNDMWLHITREHNIPSRHVAVTPSKRSKTKKWATYRTLAAYSVLAQCVSQTCLVEALVGCAVLLSLFPLQDRSDVLKY